ncbi:hypothetical protein ACFWVC_14155 [Streptomyces sp. NPDC058691]|uniref:hypothetical protein n=1 Tax=Streptomyces sp. NPDC058691 TaxID=3346601 RepID=UPI0036623100
MTGVVVSTHERQTAVKSWLRAAALNPQKTLEEWATSGFTLLECGTLFSAVRIPADLVHAAAQSVEPVDVDAFLLQALSGGPVIVDPHRQRFYALVPDSTSLRWDVLGTLCLGRSSCLGVPRPDLTEPQRDRSYWSVPMDSPGDLCVPGEVMQMIERGRALPLPGAEAKR